ncbi:MFS transporter [Gammaproteobacteria bacterium]|nr:MFS transporter [Gammaproteobacteria bacterium]
MSSPKITLVLVSACALLLLSFGLRSSLGLYLQPISEANDWGRSVFSQSLAIQNLLWGVFAVVAGGLSDRYGNLRVMVCGAIVYALGFVVVVGVDSPLVLTAGFGVLLGAGIAGTAFGIVLPAMARAVGPSRRQLALGLGTAAGSAGQFVVVLLVSGLIAAFGWSQSLWVLAGMALLMLLFALPLAPYSGANEAAVAGDTDQNWREALKEAFSHRSYWLLTMGFFVCGFNLAFVTVHMPAYLRDEGFAVSLGSQSIALIGLFNIIGALLAGWWSTNHSKRTTLMVIYLGRAVVFSLLMVLPLSEWTVYAFSIALGLLWLATIPPTSGLVAHFFGTRYMAMLYGVVFLSHQIGSFVGVLLGGWVFDTQGNYDAVWWLSALLALGAAAMHLPIREEAVPRLRSA